MADKRDYYEVLGVAKDADEATIKRAFKRLAIKYHPDHNKDPDAGERVHGLWKGLSAAGRDSGDFSVDQKRRPYGLRSEAERRDHPCGRIYFVDWRECSEHVL